jgi:hypothetical protein
MSAPGERAAELHAPLEGDYRHHLYEARAICHRTGWVALREGEVTCGACRRRLLRRRVHGAPERSGTGTGTSPVLAALRVAVRRGRTPRAAAAR